MPPGLIVASTSRYLFAYCTEKLFDRSAPVERVDRLGGLLHEYRVAA